MSIKTEQQNIKKVIIVFIILFLIIGLFLMSFFYYKSYKRLKEMENYLNYIQEINKKLTEKNRGLTQIKVDIVYNKRTGELFPVFPDDVIPSVCVWTISGQAADYILVTRAGGAEMLYEYNENKNVVYYAYPAKYDSQSGNIMFNKSKGNFVGFTKYDWIGHLLNNEIKIIKDMKFLPPRTPIYVNCIDSQNRNYYGSIGEYK